MYCADCQVVLAHDGIAALDQLQRHSFDLMLTDYDMPGMNGLDLAQAVRKTSPNTRIVLMTGRLYGADLKGRICAMKLEGYLEKPFSLQQIRDIIQA